MTRSVRIDPENGIHHVFTRGTKRWVIFLDDVDRLRFIGVLSRMCDRHGIEVIAFCLMDNHIHLVLRCPDGGLSAALRDLKSLYARFFNDRHGSSGPIYEKRFGSVLVTSHRQLRQVVRYVHRNPYAIDGRLDLASYRWCSHAMYLGVEPAPVWMCVDVARCLFNDYRRSIERPVESDSVQNVATTRTTVCSPLVSAAAPSLSEVLVAVARAAGREVAEVHSSCRNGLIGLAVLLAQEAGYSYNEMHEPFGYRSQRGPSSAAPRTRKRLAVEPVLAATLTQARLRLWPQAA